jgi:hypothetical protein
MKFALAAAAFAAAALAGCGTATPQPVVIPTVAATAASTPDCAVIMKGLPSGDTARGVDEQGQSFYCVVP